MRVFGFARTLGDPLEVRPASATAPNNVRAHPFIPGSLLRCFRTSLPSRKQS